MCIHHVSNKIAGEGWQSKEQSGWGSHTWSHTCKSINHTPTPPTQKPNHLVGTFCRDMLHWKFCSCDMSDIVKMFCWTAGTKFFPQNMLHEIALIFNVASWHCPSKLSIMSTIERKHCLISTSHLAGLFDIFILLLIIFDRLCVFWWLFTTEDTLRCLS